MSFFKNKLQFILATSDRSVHYTILTKVLQSSGGILTLLMVTRYFDKTEQGYYYTFASILSLQVLFELGITSIITQYVAHEFAYLSLTANFVIDGDEYHKSRLASIFHLSLKWLGMLSFIMFIVIVSAGSLFFRLNETGKQVNWQLPWLLLSFSGSVFLFMNLIFAILEGLGKVQEVAKLRLGQQCVYSLLLLILIYNNGKLLSGGIALLVSLIFTGWIFSRSGYFRLFKNIWNMDTKWKVDYRNEVLPFQFRIALGNISGYFIYQLVNPVLFAIEGPVVAGQMGATQTFLNGIQSVSLSWTLTKVPKLSVYTALKDFKNLNALYKKSYRLSVSFGVTALLLFVIFVYILKEYYNEFGSRLLDITPLVLLCLTQLASIIGNCQAYYLRSFKQEPFFLNSILTGILSGIVTILCTQYYGVSGFAVGYFIVNGLLGFTWGCITFYSKKKEWAG